MKYNVESFNLDHTKVVAPYVRIASTKSGDFGDIVIKYDLRICQPNKEALPTDAIHAFEHLAANHIRDLVDKVIDFSPMGCRTGFYLTLFGVKTIEEIGDIFLKVCEYIRDYEGEIPAANEVECGNYKDLSLEGAKMIANKFIDGIKSKGNYKHFIEEK